MTKQQMSFSSPQHKIFLALVLCGPTAVVLYFSNATALSNIASQSVHRIAERPLLSDLLGDSIYGERRLPNAIIIGAKKCGTSALLFMLNIHPDIRVAKMEVHFFDTVHYQEGLEWYKKKMPLSLDNQITLEKSPGYFVTPGVPARVQAMNSSVKLLLMVREPATRVVSDYTHDRSVRRHSRFYAKPFDEFVLRSDGNINSSYGPVPVSQYVDHLRRWLKYFPRAQILVVDGDKFATDNPYPALQKIEKFLGVPPKLRSENFYFNATKGFYCMKRESGIVMCMNSGKGRPHANVSESTMTKLRQYFAPFNERFYKITGQDFSWPTS